MCHCELSSCQLARSMYFVVQMCANEKTRDSLCSKFVAHCEYVCEFVTHDEYVSSS